MKGVRKLKTYDDIHVMMYKGAVKQCVVMPLEILVSEMLPPSIPTDFGTEALKAQAILIRTNITRQLPLYGGTGCGLYPEADICDTGHCLRWMTPVGHVGASGDKCCQNWARIVEAVQSTRGEIIVIKGKPILAYYHECCGGATENSEDIIENRVLYLRRVLCDYCKGSVAWEHEKSFSLKEIGEKLGVKVKGLNGDAGPSIEGFIEEISRDNAGRIRSIRVSGQSFKGADIKDLLGLTSTRFHWKPAILKFTSKGKGHGLGMCQYGAATMAREGSSYEDIINYYFTGVDIVMVTGGGDRPLRGKIFVLDPGHGGESRGNIGPRGLMEKNINLDIALKLEAMLQEAGAKVHMTRREDARVLLSDRTDMVNRIRPHFFLSIHQNNFYNPNISGTEMYYYSGDDEGKRLGRCIMDRLVKEVGTLDKGIKKANFFVLREVKVSSLLMELFYITNLEEERKLRDEGFRSKVAEALYNGIMSYYRCGILKQV